MKDHSELDVLGELFRQRLENHRIPVDDSDWSVIERRLGKRKTRPAIWLWSAGAAAAAIAMLLIIRQPVANQGVVTAVVQQENLEETGIAVHHPEDQEVIQRLPSANSQVRYKDSKIQRFKDSKIDFAELPNSDQSINDSVIQPFNDSVTQSVNDSVNQSFNNLVIPEKKLDISLVEDKPDEDETDVKKPDKWLLAAAFGIGGYSNVLNDNHSDMYNAPSSGSVSSKTMGLSGSNNEYAANLSGSVRSFSDMSRSDFTNISHRPPLSFGLTAHKSLGKGGGWETGLVYTFLSSRYEWEGYHVNQSLHYVGIPVNMVVYLWNSNPNWRVYLSGGFMAEKGLRAIYRQERQLPSEHRITTVKSSINGLQWSLNGALGINYKLEKGWGIYFEPRVGYSFDCNQPVSIRTEMPVFFGINMGLNYEL